VSSTAIASDPPFSRDDTKFLGHPLGLGWLAFCEFWERFSYYGMQGLLGLYLTKYLFLPEHITQVMGIDAGRRAIEFITGPMTPFQFGSLVVGLYGGLVYLTPIFGGIIADRWLGRTRAVVTGASLMALGHFLMAFEAGFLIAIACLLVGVGLFKGNIAAQVGALYRPGDKRNASAFQIFLLAVQIAVIVSPLVCGSLGEKVAWHWGFDAAGVGMLIGLITYLAGRGWLPPEPERKSASATIEQPKITPREWGRVAILVGIIPILMLTILGNQQISTGFPLWSDKHMDLVMFGWRVPTTWLQVVDAVVSLVTMLMSIAFWKWWSQRRNEPDELVKMALGTLIAAAGPGAMMIAGGIVDATHARVGFGWTLAYTIFNDIGFANILPVGLALYSRCAPKQIVGLVIGIYYLHLSIGNTYVGWLAGLMEKMPSAQFWGMHAALVALGGGLLVVVRLLFWRWLSPAAILPAGAPAVPDAPLAPAH